MISIDGLPLPVEAKDTIQSVLRDMFEYGGREAVSLSVDEAVKALRRDGEPAATGINDYLAHSIQPLRQISIYLRALYQVQCERESTAPELEAIRRMEEYVESHTVNGRKLVINGDPRGNAVGIIMRNGTSNNMGGEDWRL